MVSNKDKKLVIQQEDEIINFLKEGKKPNGFYTKIALKATKELDDYIYVHLIKYYIKTWETVKVKTYKARFIYQLAVEAARNHLANQEKAEL